MSARASGTYVELDDAWNDPGWTRIPNGVARCTTISRRLKGWILEVASHAPGRRITFNDMLSASTDGRDATYATIKEGVTSGFVTRHQERDASGRMGVMVYRVHVTPQLSPDSPVTAKPETAKPETSKKTRSSLEDYESLTSSETPDGVTDEDKSGQEADTQARPDVVQLCNRLRDLMIENGCKPPTIGKQWETAARLLLDRDKRDIREALWMLGWCQRDEFWRTNILSMPKFRARYDQLVLRAKAEVTKRRNGQGSVGDGSGEPMVPVQVHRGGQRLVPARWFSVTSPPEDWDPARDPFDRVPGPDLPGWHWRRRNEQ